MKYSFLWDTTFLKWSEKINFSNILDCLKNSKIILNLESIFEENWKNYKNIKNKISLKQTENKINLLKNINPYLVNTSNNHSNDCWNIWINFTKKILNKNNIRNFWSWNIQDNHNFFINEIEKNIFLSFTTRETDLTGSLLWETEEIQWPKNIDLKYIKKVKQKYKNYKIIILMHWGYEHQNYPHPKIRELWKKIIDNWANLIIWSHSHVIQWYEKYKWKYIFYSLWNFLFNDIKYESNWIKYNFYQYNRSKKWIIPIFNFNKTNIELDKVLLFKIWKAEYKVENNYLKIYNLFFNLNDYLYKIFFFIYSKLNLFRMVWELKVYQLIREKSEK